MALAQWDTDDAELILRAITDQALCAGCITARTGVPRARATAIVVTLSETLTIERTIAPCQGCGLSHQEIIRLF